MLQLCWPQPWSPLLEFAIPYDSTWHPNSDDVKNDLLFMVTVQMVLPQMLTFVVSITLLGYLSSLNFAVSQLWPHQLPLVVQVTMMLLVAEFFRYWLHVAAHNTQLLWAASRGTPFPEKALLAERGRFHPIEKALQFLLDALPFILVGVSQEVLAGYFVFYAVNGFFQHSNVDGAIRNPQLRCQRGGTAPLAPLQAHPRVQSELRKQPDRLGSGLWKLVSPQRPPSG